MLVKYALRSLLSLAAKLTVWAFGWPMGMWAQLGGTDADLDALFVAANAK